VSGKTDVADLSAHVWQRHCNRMAGLTDDEWQWCPTPDASIGLRWRLDHVAEALGSARNPVWLGLADRAEDAAGVAGEDASADDALRRGDEVYRRWSGWVSEVDDVDLATPIGAVGGPYGDASRMSFVLHIVDELIHHTAEAALLRDLYARR
jgi:hypothetical protein